MMYLRIQLNDVPKALAQSLDTEHMPNKWWLLLGVVGTGYYLGRWCYREIRPALLEERSS